LKIASTRRDDRNGLVVPAELAHDLEGIEAVGLGFNDDQIRSPLSEGGEGFGGGRGGDRSVGRSSQ